MKKHLRSFIVLLFVSLISKGLLGQTKVVGGYFTVVSGSYLVDVSSTGITINSGSTLNQNGILNLKGNFSNAGSVISGLSSEVQLTGTSQQTLSGATVFNDVLLNNLNGLAISSGNQQINGNLNLLNGVLSLNSNGLKVNTISVVSPGISRMIDAGSSGYISKDFASGDPIGFTFPIGELIGTPEYSPLYLDLSTNSATREIGVRVKDSFHPNEPSPPHHVSRYWEFSSSPSSGNYDYSINAQAVSVDEVGNMALVQPQIWNGTAWLAQTGTYLSSLASYSSNQTSGSLSNSAVAIFETQFSEIDIQQSSSSIPSGTGSFDFGAVCLGASSSSITFSISNSGNIPLILSGSPLIQISGPNASDFSITQPSVSSIAPNASATFSIVFSPSSSGVRNAQISIANTDGNENPYTFSLSGNGDLQPVAGSVSGGGSTICQGGSTGTLSLSGQSGQIIKWQYNLNSAGWNDISNTLSTYSTSLLSPGIYEYRVEVGNGSCSSVMTAPVLISVSATSVGGSVSGGGSICLGQSTGTLTLSGQTGGVSGWEVSTDNGTTYSPIANTTTSYSTNPPAVGTYLYRAVVASGVCPSAYSSPATIVVNSVCNLVWTGAIDRDWNTAGNWLPTIVPGTLNDVLIPDVANDPIVGSYTANCANFSIQSGATFGFSGGVASSILIINGATPLITTSANVFSGSGVFQIGTGGSIATISGGATFNNDRVFLPANSKLKLNGSTDFNIGRTIRANSGAAVYSFGSNNTTDYPSTPNATAYLHFTDDGVNNGIVDYNSGNANGFILGQVKTDRKIVASNTGYRYIGSPIQGAISQWSDDFTITGANGFLHTGTAYTNPWPSLWNYEETNPNPNMAYGWVSNTDLINTLDRGTGYAAITPGNIVLDLAGPLWILNGNFTGALTKSVTRTSSGQALSDGWNLIANPYQAPLNFPSLQSTNNSIVAAYAYYWVSNGIYSGNYGSYNALTSISTNGGTQFVATHQGFMIKATNTGTISFNHSMTGNSTAYAFLKSEESNPDMPVVRLSIKDKDLITDEMVVAMHSNAKIEDADDEYDTEKFFSNDFSLPLFYLTEAENKDHKMAVSVLPTFNSASVVPIGIGKPGYFRAEITQMANIPMQTKVYLEDRKLNQFIKLNLADQLSLSRSENESAEGRYFLRFGDEWNASEAAAIQMVGKAYYADNGIKIWLQDAGINPSLAKVMDMNGKLIASFDLFQNNGDNYLSDVNLAPGIYLVDVSADKGHFVNKIVVPVRED